MPKASVSGLDAHDDDELVSVAYANDRVEAEMIQGLLESAGIPSALQHLGIDGPQLGFGLLNPGGGSRRVMVRADHAEKARAVLGETLVEHEPGDWAEIDDGTYQEEVEGRKPRDYTLLGAYTRAWTLSVGIVILAFAVFLLQREI